VPRQIDDATVACKLTATEIAERHNGQVAEHAEALAKHAEAIRACGRKVLGPRARVPS
jgi:hypothetical protein